MEIGFPNKSVQFPNLKLSSIKQNPLSNIQKIPAPPTEYPSH